MRKYNTILSLVFFICDLFILGSRIETSPQKYVGFQCTYTYNYITILVWTQITMIAYNIFQTIRKLSYLTLPIPMSPKIEWVLDKTHVRVAFRQAVSTNYLYHRLKFHALIIIGLQSVFR